MLPNVHRIYSEIHCFRLRRERVLTGRAQLRYPDNEIDIIQLRVNYCDRFLNNSEKAREGGLVNRVSKFPAAERYLPE